MDTEIRESVSRVAAETSRERLTEPPPPPPLPRRCNTVINLVLEAFILIVVFIPTAVCLQFQLILIKIPYPSEREKQESKEFRARCEE